MLKGVCLSNPEREHAVLGLTAELEKRKTWFALQDILLRDVLPAVYQTTIPDGERIELEPPRKHQRDPAVDLARHRRTNRCAITGPRPKYGRA